MKWAASEEVMHAWRQGAQTLLLFLPPPVSASELLGPKSRGTLSVRSMGVRFGVFPCAFVELRDAGRNPC